MDKIEKSENTNDNNQDKTKEHEKSTQENKINIDMDIDKDVDKKDTQCCNHGDGHEHHHEEKKVVDPNQGITTFELGDELHKFDSDDEVII